MASLSEPADGTKQSIYFTLLLFEDSICLPHILEGTLSEGKGLDLFFIVSPRC